MTAHVMFPALDENFPATMSQAILRGLLRGQMGYTGVIVSDDMEMKAVRGRYPVEHQMDKAVSAGVDAFLVCSKADLQAECVESLIKLQEQSEQHEQWAEASIQRLSKQMLTRQKHRAIPLPKYQPDQWDSLCLEIQQQFESRLG